jgi:hypothetical protein
MTETKESQAQTVASVVRDADERLYKTLVWAPVVGRMVYFLFFACVAITGYIWRVDARLNSSANDQRQMQQEITYNYKLYQQLFRFVHNGEEPPPLPGPDDK